MADVVALTKICERLAERYGDQGRAAAERLRQWLSGAVPYAYPEILQKHLDESHLALLFDAFWQVLPFGTGGRRGRVGYGPNRLNPTTVAMTVQGHCQYLRAAFPRASQDLTVVVANDVRVFNDIAGTYDFLGRDHPLLGVSSRSLAKRACEIYAGNGIVAYIAQPRADQAVMTTPELSFVINQLKAVGGINLSASHNHPDDNGVKVYDQHGSQPVAPHDQQLVDVMNRATEIRSLPFDQALEQGTIRGIPDQLHQEYIKTYVTLYDNSSPHRPDVPIVYTPLCGCGLTTVGDVLKRLEFPIMIPPDQGPDGTFSVIPFKAPNPEVAQATEPAKAFADEKGARIVLSSDPDADRVGLEIKLADGSWYHFDGNQIAAVLCYFLMLDPRGPQRKGLVIETLVTTRMLGKIVEKAGDSWVIDDLLVGFKYVADVLKELERPPSLRSQISNLKFQKYAHIPCSPNQLVLAAEESHGVMMVPTIRDKDATPACMYLAALYQRLHQEGRTLLDYYIQILEELGGYDDVNRSIMMAGAEGVLRRDRIMASLRDSPPQTLGGRPVRKVVDYWDQEEFGPFVSETDKLPRNVIQISTDAFLVAVRPSGTEPKLKFYCQLLPQEEPGIREQGAREQTTLTPSTSSTPSMQSDRGMDLLREARTKADAIARLVYNELLARIDRSLSEAGLLLLDIVDLDRKRDFEQRTVPRLHEALVKRTFTHLKDLLTWLRQEAEAMTPGADPLPALKAPVAYLCTQWAGELASIPLFVELENWAKQ
jgi:phosphoglucomutase/phosphomannomutase